MSLTGRVINALRHLRLEHDLSIINDAKASFVINALRHLRLEHLQEFVQNRDRLHVINALRHLRLEHRILVEPIEDAVDE